ncbi:hypothetical protein MMC09_000352 [Bachmanniomyces sp. S44760]|nr:hypothetical protein [Bachmanniomyces sp. S44760]
MNRSSWSLSKSRGIRLEDGMSKVPAQNLPVPKAALTDGIFNLLATAAEMQQRQDLESANQLYEAAIAKIKAHCLDRRKFLTGTAKRPPPLNSRTPLEWSIHAGDIKSAITLLGDPNTALARLRTALSPERLQEVLRQGANIEYRIGPIGRTLLLQEASEGHYSGVRLALDHGASVTCMDDAGDTALALALRCKNTQSDLIVEDLLKAGADITLNDGQGQSLLKTALIHADLQVIILVIDALSPLTAKHHAEIQEYAANLPLEGNKLSNRTSSLIRLLLQHGLDPNTQCRVAEKPTLLDVASQQQGETSDGLVSELLEHGAEPRLDAALLHAQPPYVDLILSKLAPLNDIHRKQMVGWVQSTLSRSKIWSSRDGKVLKSLLDFGLDSNLRSEESPHSALILCAADSGDLAMVEKLIALKANLSVSNDVSDTAIICAARHNNRPIYDALKVGGVDDRYFLGWTVWSYHSSG